MLCSTAWLFCFSTTGDDPAPSGIPRLALAAPLRCVSADADDGGELLVWMGNLVSAGPADRSLLCARPLLGGAGLVARDFEAIARLRASMFTRRLLSSVLIARTRGIDDAPATVPAAVALAAAEACAWELARLSSPKMASLWANRSRIRR